MQVAEVDEYGGPYKSSHHLKYMRLKHVIR